MRLPFPRLTPILALSFSIAALLVLAGGFSPLRLPVLAAGATVAQPVVSQSRPTVGSQVISDIQQVLAMSYDVTDIVTTYDSHGTPFIGISGLKIPTADGYTQQVFFFSGSSFLGTDTSGTSPGAVVTGSPAPGQINVRYENYAPDDPLCCPSRAPVTITYSYDGSTVSASGTPPGH
jgi:hypothetical protein